MQNVEDIYPLSPTQTGILFHTVRNPQSGVYVGQFSGVMEGQLNIDAFQRAWQQVVDRHPSLRTAFLWESIDQPLQVVRQKVTHPFEFYDWSGLEKTELDLRFEQFLRDDRTQGFNLAQAPLSRVAVMQTSTLTYRLLWTAHHLIADGWSSPLILRDLFALYGAECGGSLATLPERRPYRDYIAWLQKQDMSEAEAFWRKALAGVDKATEIPVRRSFETGAAVATYANRIRRLDTETMVRLQSVAQRERLTLNTLVQGAWALLLSRYSGESEVLYGTTVSGRPTELRGIEDMIGLFINTLPMRVKIDPAQGLVQWLQGIQEDQLQMRQYEYSPLADIQRWSPMRSGSSLFESILVFENYPLDGTTVSGPDMPLQFRNIRFQNQSNYPLNLLVIPEDGLTLELAFDQSQFDDERIASMLGHLCTLLEAMSRHPAQRVAEFSIHSASEERQILLDWNDTARDFPAHRMIHELIEEQAALNPKATAVVFEDSRLSYAELNNQADRLAQILVDAGVGPNIPVGLCLERSTDMLVAILGVLKAGGAYLPLDPTYPQSRLAFILDETRAPVVLLQSHLQDRLPSTNARQICLDMPWPATGPNGANGKAPAPSTTSPDDLAYIIYTSGSTGLPKGVPISHRNLVHSTWARFDYYRKPVETFLLLSSFAFDSSVVGIFWTLCQGGTLVLPRQGEEQDIHALATLIDKHQVTHMLCLPTLYALLLEYAPAEQLAGLKTVVVAGEACAPRVVAKHYQTVPGAALYNEYGPTEATVWSTVYQVPDRVTKFVSIGRPIPNMEAYILDGALRPMPIGVPGELYIGGAGVASGYFKRPELTNERFIPHPFHSTPGTLLYRTGDRASYLSDGTIRFLGRVDEQIKLRGFRIEPGEIEALLLQQAGISAAAVVLHTPGEQSPTVLGADDIEGLTMALAALDTPEARALLEEIELFAHLPEGNTAQ